MYNRQACTSFTTGTEFCLQKEKYRIIVRCNCFHSPHNSSNNGRSSHNRIEVEVTLIAHIARKKAVHGATVFQSDRQSQNFSKKKNFCSQKKNIIVGRSSLLTTVLDCPYLKNSLYFTLLAYIYANIK